MGHFQIRGKREEPRTQDTPFAQHEPEVILQAGDQQFTFTDGRRAVIHQVKTTNPWVVTIQNFASEEECKRIVELASPYLERSRVVGADNNHVSTVRTSNGMFLQRPEHLNDPTVKSLRQRISDLAKLPVTNIESTQVLLYKEQQQYLPHNDWFSMGDSSNLGRGGQRVKSALLFLNDVGHGGETEFPMAGVSIPPKRGTLILWNNVNNGVADMYSQHAGRQPKDGSEKWVAVWWVREREFH